MTVSTVIYGVHYCIIQSQKRFTRVISDVIQPNLIRHVLHRLMMLPTDQHLLDAEYGWVFVIPDVVDVVGPKAVKMPTGSIPHVSGGDEQVFGREIDKRVVIDVPDCRVNQWLEASQVIRDANVCPRHPNGHVLDEHHLGRLDVELANNNRRVPNAQHAHGTAITASRCALESVSVHIRASSCGCRVCSQPGMDGEGQRLAGLRSGSR